MFPVHLLGLVNIMLNLTQWIWILKETHGHLTTMEHQGNHGRYPIYYMVDFHAGYTWYIKDIGFSLRGSVLNALDGVYVTDAQNNDSYLSLATNGFNANSASVFMGMGRRFNLSLRINF